MSMSSCSPLLLSNQNHIQYYARSSCTDSIDAILYILDMMISAMIQTIYRIKYDVSIIDGD